MCDKDTILEPNHDLTTCPYFLEEYDRVQDSMNMVLNNTQLEQTYNEPTNIPWYIEYNPLVYLGVFVLLLLIYKLKK